MLFQRAQALLVGDISLGDLGNLGGWASIFHSTSLTAEEEIAQRRGHKTNTLVPFEEDPPEKHG